MLLHSEHKDVSFIILQVCLLMLVKCTIYWTNYCFVASPSTAHWSSPPPSFSVCLPVAKEEWQTEWPQAGTERVLCDPPARSHRLKRALKQNSDRSWWTEMDCISTESTQSWPRVWPLLLLLMFSSEHGYLQLSHTSGALSCPDREPHSFIFPVAFLICVCVCQLSSFTPSFRRCLVGGITYFPQTWLALMSNVGL